MKNLLLSILLISVFFLNAQQFDESFLDSLPDDIREDLVNRSEENTKALDENYRPSQYSSKLQQFEELIDLKSRIEQDLRELEKRLQSDDKLEINTELKLFGSDFFNTFQTSFMPINEPNPDSSYTLGVGDVLSIQLVGQKDIIEDFLINGDGSINFPDIGEIVLIGLSLDEASKLIKSRVNSSFIGIEAFISMSKLRDVNVLITGDAQNPGIYTLSGNSNILQAINIAGGISEYGTFREINLVRDNKIIEVLDVYELLINGNFNLKERLRSGDVIFINPRKSVVSIDGAVKRPAKYELLDEQNLGDVINYANGFKQTADIQNIYLERILDGTLKSIPITNSIQFDSIKSVDGDMIYIREYPYRKATISGAVLKPGTYTMAAGETLDDLIIKAGGFTENAYPFGAIFENRDAKLINEAAQSLLYQEFLDNIIALSQQNISGNCDLTPIVGLTKEINDLDHLVAILYRKATCSHRSHFNKNDLSEYVRPIRKIKPTRKIVTHGLTLKCPIQFLYLVLLLIQPHNLHQHLLQPQHKPQHLLQPQDKPQHKPPLLQPQHLLQLQRKPQHQPQRHRRHPCRCRVRHQ